MNFKKLISNKFRVFNLTEFENFMKNVIIKDLEILTIKKDNDIYVSFNGTSNINGIFENGKIKKYCSIDEKLQELLHPEDEIIIKFISSEGDVDATVITKNSIRGIDLDTEIKYLIESMRDDE